VCGDGRANPASATTRAGRYNVDVKPFVVGALTAIASGIVTAIYLAAITIDGGFEAMLFFPVLAALLAATSGAAGWQQRPAQWPTHAALGATAATFAALVVIAVVHGPLPLAVAAVGASIVVCLVALVAAMGGWTIGNVFHRRYRGHGRTS
jgi:peptidoglycan/LPS O-acetylase OafA/YrhL